MGAGIVGSAVAASLAESGDVAVTVLEAGPADRLVGSIGHAPGFVGLLNALDLLRACSRFVPQRRLNGVFAMTPDNLPLLGPVEDLAGLWVAEALWVTHAGGAAAALAAGMTGREPAMAGLDVLHPQRFRGQPHDELRERAPRPYRDIYATA